MYVLLHDRKDLSGHSLSSSFQPAKCSSSDATSDEDDDDENSDDDSVSPSEIHDVIEDAKAFRENLNRQIEQTESFLNAEQISAQDPKQESVEQVGGEVNTSKDTPSDRFYEEYEEE